MLKTALFIINLVTMPANEKDFSFHRKLKQEIELWLKESIITPEQKDKILARYKLLKEADEKAGPGKLITVISVMGSILVGVGVILFIASNWAEIPRWGKLSIIFTSMLLSYSLGFYLRREKENYPKIGAALILLGSLIFGAGIFLIAQIYHITVHYPNGPLMWGLGVLPLAYLLRLKTLLSLTIIDLLIWLGMEASFRMPVNLFYAGPLIFVALFFMAGIALWSTGLMHRGFESLKKISGPYILYGAFITFTAGYVLTFDVFRGSFGAGNFLDFYLGILGLFLISIILYIFSRDKGKGWLPEALSLFILMALMISLALSYRPTERMPYDFRSETINIMTLTSNIIYILGIVGIIVLGYIRRYNAYINIGLLFFVLDVIARYFDFFWRLLPRSIFFITGGVILLLGGVMLEKKRRRILASFRIEEAD